LRAETIGADGTAMTSTDILRPRLGSRNDEGTEEIVENRDIVEDIYRERMPTTAASR
jgi:hypothetical protein